MGDPKRFRKKYTGPKHPWQKARIVSEVELKNEFGLKNKTEIWKMASKIKTFASNAKKLTTLHSNQSTKEMNLLLTRLTSLGLLNKEAANLDDVLNLETKDILERRLQTIVTKKGLARTAKQARQFIVHKHIMVDGKIITSPSHLVTKLEEATIMFIPSSKLSDPNHPERIIVEKKDQGKAKSENVNPDEEPELVKLKEEDIVE